MTNTREISLRFCSGLIGLMLLIQLAPAAEPYTENPGVEGDGNHVVGPEYKIDPDLTDRGNPKGKYFEFTHAAG